MTVADTEFRVQVMETEAQWATGLRNSLKLDNEGLSLFLNPVFESRLVVQNWNLRAGDIVVDECGQTYWTAIEPDSRSDQDQIWYLFRHNPITNQVEKVLTFPACGKIHPRKLWLTDAYLWIFNQADTPSGESEKKGFSGRVLALSRDTFQIVHELAIENLLDVDFDKEKFFYGLVDKGGGQQQICRYPLPSGPSTEVECFTLTQSKNQVALAVGRNGIVYLVDNDIGRIVRFDPTTKEETLLGAPQEAVLKKKPSAMEIDERGVIFLTIEDSEAAGSRVGDGSTIHLYMFDEDGSFLKEAELPSSVKTIDGIGFDRDGGVYLATDQGLLKFTLSRNRIGQEGSFYSKTLDNGQPEGLWHRIALQGSLPSKSSVEVFYYASDNTALKNAYERVLEGSASVEEKTLQLENLLSNSWIGPEVFKGTTAPNSQFQIPLLSTADLIIDPNKGRFLWFKLKLITFDQKSRPSIRSVRIYYPRLSYLRYLPPAYREEPVSAAFLERFLSIFETGFKGLDQEIDQLFRYFDPALTPKDFLPWLASWINLLIDEDLPEARVRQLIHRAPYLYNRKGTAEALTEFFEIYTGRSVYLTEFAHGLRPLVLGGPDFQLGRRLILLGTGPKGMRVGDTTILGQAAIRDRVSDADEPFLPLARRFTIVIDMDREEFQRRLPTLQRIATEQIPAHTTCNIRTSGEQGGVGNAVLGISATVTDSRPYRVGITPLGTASAMAKDSRRLRLERGAWVGSSGRM